MPISLTAEQRAAIDSAQSGRLFVSGPPGTGKSTVGVEVLKILLARAASPDSVLVLTPQRTLQDPYLQTIRSPEISPGVQATTATIGGLARRMCDLFWPLLVDRAGFADASRPPLFLTLETAQYYMAHIVRPLLEQGYFESLTIDRNRLYAQIIDNLNKSAAVGFPSTEIGARLDSAWSGESSQRHVYQDAQDCANRFRRFCLDHNMLDFSLQLEAFWTHLWPDPLVHDYLLRTYRHLIYDNVEEDVPRAHDLVGAWLPDLDSALLIYDEGGGHRRFLGSDPATGRSLGELCERHDEFGGNFVMSEPIVGLAAALRGAFEGQRASDRGIPGEQGLDSIATGRSASRAVQVVSRRFYPQLLDAVADEVSALLSPDPPSGATLAADQIAILAPYLSDALRFAITSRLSARNVPWRTHRPSRSLREEPAVLAALTIAAIAHPHWNVRPPKLDVSHALMLGLGIDLVRAQLLTDIVYRPRELTLSSFDAINPGMQERVTFVFGDRYMRLREWLLDYGGSTPAPLDHFLRRLFGEILSQPGFGLHHDMDGARVVGNLVESVRNFRLAMEPAFVGRDHPDFDSGREYYAVLQDGVIAAQYLEAWRPGPNEAVLVAPAHSFLMMNRPVAVQIWLDPGSSGWYQRLDQPLTHTYVLSREWPAGRQWTFADEEAANRETLSRLVLGLLHRCRERIYLGITALGESGFEERGQLLYSLQEVLNDQSGA